MIFNLNSKVGSNKTVGVPEFTYTGTYEIVDDNNNALTNLKAENWRIRFLTSGNLTFTNLKGTEKGMEVFLVGGGGNGSSGSGSSTGAGGGGGGGYIKQQDFIVPKLENTYKITIGGAAGNTTAFGVTANCGKKGALLYGGGAGTGSGGKGGGYNGSINGSSGGSGKPEFNVGPNYYGGGGGGGANYYTNEGTQTSGSGGSGGKGGGGKGGTVSSKGTNGTKNTGGGGGGSGSKQTSSYASGGSGIVIIRNSRNTSVLYEDAPFSGTVNATDSLNVRNIPSSTASGTKVNGTLAYQRKVKVHGLSLDTDSSKTYIWAKIQESDISGWCNSSYLTIDAQGMINKEEGVTMYSSASTTGSVVANLPFKAPVQVTQFVYGNKLIWAKVSSNYNGISYSGYVLREHINFSGN